LAARPKEDRVVTRTITVARVDGEPESLSLLQFLGGSFITGSRFDQFVDDTWRARGRSEEIDWSNCQAITDPLVEVWAHYDPFGNVLGAMSLHYYGWSRLRQQRYFSVTSKGCDDHRISVQPFQSIVSNRLQPWSEPVLGVELGYFSVRDDMRGRGVGGMLFDAFVGQVQSLPPVPKLAFTIVMARYAQTMLGRCLMEALLESGATGRRGANLYDTMDTLDLPFDLWEPNSRALPTVSLARRRSFGMIGHGRNLGQVWARTM
jgi:GNAT superfamily N-acetyltransferase